MEGVNGSSCCSCDPLQLRGAPRQFNRTPRAFRKNPERSSRPHTRSRSLVDGPPSPAPEEEPEDKFSLVRKSRYYEEVDEPVRVHAVSHVTSCESRPNRVHLFHQQPRRRSFTGTKALPHVVRPVEDVTEAELQRICYSVRDKVYNSSTVGSAGAHRV